MKLVILSSSLRTDSNSEQLAKAFADGAAAAGHSVEFHSLRGKKLQFCTGCMACQKLHRCVLEDGASALLETVRTADALVFATPVYYYAVSGQLKTFLDRMNPIFSAGHRYRSVYLLATAAEDDPSAMDGAVKDLQGWVDCFDGVELRGVLRATGVDAPGAVRGRPDYLAKAREMGENIQ